VTGVQTCALPILEGKGNEVGSVCVMWRERGLKWAVYVSCGGIGECIKAFGCKL
jgi:hypothetical protein